MQQHQVADPDIRVPIPAPIVKQMLQFAHRHDRALTGQPNNLVHIKTFRAVSQSVLTIAIIAARNRSTLPHGRHSDRHDGR
jgi:hypothetical protein